MATKKATERTIPRKVSFLHFDDDFGVATLANFGWHTKAIARETGLTPSQVTYRCQRAGIKRGDYRNGLNEHSRRVLVAQDVLFTKVEIKTIRQQLEENKDKALQEIAARTRKLKKKTK